MTEKEEYYTPVYGEDGKIISIKHGTYYKEEITSLEEVINTLNEQHGTIVMWCKSSSKLKKLLEENTKPTANDGGEDVYLSIGENKRCRYENTLICNKCGYFSSYFLDCRLMMEDNQYQKAKQLGLVKE